jgi:hypothetical protein
LILLVALSLSTISLLLNAQSGNDASADQSARTNMGTPFYLTSYSGTCTGTIDGGKPITVQCAVILQPSLRSSCAGDTNLIKSRNNIQGMPLIFHLNGDGKNFTLVNCPHNAPGSGGGTADEKSLRAHFIAPMSNSGLGDKNMTIDMNLAFQSYPKGLQR